MRDRRSLITPFVMMIALFFAISLSFITVKAESPEGGLKNPEINSAGITTWDCVYFGHYPQGADGSGGFINEPIKWRVLKVDGDDAFLLSDKNIDKMPFCKSEPNPSFSSLWHVSTVRSWLNGYGAEENQKQIDYSTDNFIEKAFNAEEQEAIKTTLVITDKYTDWHFNWIDQHHYYMETSDKVYLLEFDEMLNPDYGFTAEEEETVKRVSLNTAYAAAGGTGGIPYGKEGDKDSWILRSPGEYSYYVDMVTADGEYKEDISDICQVTAAEGIRPVLHLDLTKTDVYSYAGKAVAREQQSITVSAQFLKKWGDAAFNLNASTNGDSVLAYTSDNEAVAMVDQKGNVTPKGLGTAVITITASETDNYSGTSKTVKVIVNKRSTEIVADAELVKFLGDKAFNINASVITDGTLTYESDNPSVVTVAEDGTVTIVGIGTANITITASGTDNCYEAVKTVQVTVKKAVPVVVKKQEAKITFKKITATVKYKKLKKKAQSFSIGASVNSKGKLTYKKISGKKQVTINKSGKVTIKKKTKKGTYKIKVKVSVAAKGNYKAGTKTVTITVKVK